MPSPLAVLLRTHRSRLKTEWRARLRARPPNTSLAHPDILRHQMDGTLNELVWLLDGPPSARWLAHGVPGAGPQPGQCRCGLNPLLDYFATGAAAWEAVLGPGLDATERTQLDRAWHFLAQREIGSLCGVCCRAGGPPRECPVKPR